MGDHYNGRSEAVPVTLFGNVVPASLLTGAVILWLNLYDVVLTVIEPLAFSQSESISETLINSTSEGS